MDVQNPDWIGKENKHKEKNLRTDSSEVSSRPLSALKCDFDARPISELFHSDQTQTNEKQVTWLMHQGYKDSDWNELMQQS